MVWFEVVLIIVSNILFMDMYYCSLYHEYIPTKLSIFINASKYLGFVNSEHAVAEYKFDMNILSVKMPSLWYLKINPSIFAMMRRKNLIISLVDGSLHVYDMC